MTEHKDPPEHGEIVSLDQRRRDKGTGNKPKHSKPDQGPLINLPPATKWLALCIIGVYLFQEIALTTEGKLLFFLNLGFIPALITQLNFNSILTPLTPLTYMFVHGTLLHILINTLMLLAFGSAVEKWLGSRRLFILFFGCGILAAGVHLAFAPYDEQPVIGASGATSGLFAAGLVLLRNMGTGIGSGPGGLLPLALAWIGISFLFGLTGSPDGQSVAWVAHIGGFLAGFGFLKFMQKL